MISSLEVEPTTALVGSEVLLRAAASDPDSNGVTFRWTPSIGSVGDPTASSTTYRCLVPGLVTFAMTVSDGECNDADMVAALCVAEP